MVATSETNDRILFFFCCCFANDSMLALSNRKDLARRSRKRCTALGGPVPIPDPRQCHRPMGWRFWILWSEHFRIDPSSSLVRGSQHCVCFYRPTKNVSIRMFATKTWFLEKHNFTYGSPQNNLFEVGHYTQMVWAATHKVGCGFTKCPYRPDKRSSKRTGGRSTKHPKYFYNYVCNYCPMWVFWFHLFVLFCDLNRHLITNGSLVFAEGITWNVWAALTRKARLAADARARASCVNSVPTPAHTPICGSTVASWTPRGTSGSVTTIPRKDWTERDTVEQLVNVLVKSTHSSDASKCRNISNEQLLRINKTKK